MNAWQRRWWFEQSPSLEDIWWGWNLWQIVLGLEHMFKPETFCLTSASALWLRWWEAWVLPPLRKQMQIVRLGRSCIPAGQETLTTILYQKRLSPYPSLFPVYPTPKVKTIEMEASLVLKIFPKSETRFSSVWLTAALTPSSVYPDLRWPPLSALVIQFFVDSGR